MRPLTMSLQSGPTNRTLILNKRRMTSGTYGLVTASAKAFVSQRQKFMIIFPFGGTNATTLHTSITNTKDVSVTESS